MGNCHHKVYTKGFINAEMLDENGKKPYCQLSIEERKFIDVKSGQLETCKLFFKKVV